jgi:arylsulfatase A-like enzyme
MERSGVGAELVSAQRAGRLPPYTSGAARRTGAVALAIATLAGCGGGESAAERAHDLTAAFPVAEVRREIGRIDFGTPAAREHLLAGWYANERARGGETFVWSQGAASTLAFFLAAPRPLRAELLCAPAPDVAARRQVVTLEVGGRRVGALVLSPGVHAYSVELPADVLRAGVNRLTFRYGHTTLPRAGGREGRRLAVAWHDLQLPPLPQRAAAPRVDGAAPALVLPWGTEVAYALDLEGEARLEIEEVAAPGGAGGRLIVAVQQEEDQVEREVAAVQPAPASRAVPAGGGGAAARIALSGTGRRLVRVALRAVPEPDSERASGGLRLRGPAVVVAGSANPLPALASLSAASVHPAATAPSGAPASSPAVSGTSATLPSPSSLPGSSSSSLPGSSSLSGSSPPSTPARQLAAARPNLLVYLIDALRADRLGCYGNRRGLTPHTDAFAARALLFEHAVAQAPWTRPAVASILTGLGPLRHGVRTLDDRLPDAAVTLAERLRAAGYRTAAFSTNAHVTRDTGLAQGFAHFDFSPEAASSEAANRRLLAWLDGAGGEAPFFAYVHAIDPHAPYTPPADLRRRFAPGVPPRAGTKAGVQRAYAARGAERARLVADLALLYDAEVAANDRSFGELLAALAARRLLDRTAVVLVADHGEEFDEHGALGHANNLYAETLRIPLIVKLPRQARGRRIRALAQQIDLVPTLLAQAGHGRPAGLGGIDLTRLATAAPRSPAGDRPAVSHLSYRGRSGVSVVLGDWKLIQPLTPAFGRGGPELFRLREGARESAAENLIDRNPVRAGHLAAFLRAERLAAQGGLAPERATLDPETRRALEALGYL